MNNQVTMTFERDMHDKGGCLEYSWIPEGHRHTIRLSPGQSLGSETDLTADSKGGKVQVYVLANNERVSAEIPFFPLGSAPDFNIIGATVNVSEQRMKVICTAHYADGSTLTDERPLDHHPRPCPQLT